MSGKCLPYCRSFKQLANRVDRDARVAIHVWYLVEIALNRAKAVVILELDAAMKFQVIQRARHTTIRQAGERLEVNCGTFRPHNCFRHPKILEHVSQRVCEV